MRKDRRALIDIIRLMKYLCFIDAGLECLQSGSKLDKSECLKAVGLGVPDQSERCTVDCQSGSGDCVIGHWSPWSQCTPECPSTRKRERDVSHECSAPTPDGVSSAPPLITQVHPETPTGQRSKGPLSTEVEGCPCGQYRYNGVNVLNKVITLNSF